MKLIIFKIFKEKMQQELKKLARKHGQRARVYSTRLATLLSLYRNDPIKHKWMRHEAVNLSRVAAYHMRHADTLGKMIIAIETRNKKKIL